MFSVFLLLSRGSCRCRWSALCFSAGSRTPRRCRWSCSASFCCSRAPPLQLVRVLLLLWLAHVLAVAGGRVRCPFVAFARFSPLQVVRVMLLLGLAHDSPLQVVVFGVLLLLSCGFRRCRWSAFCFSSGSRTSRRCRWSCSASFCFSRAVLAVAVGPRPASPRARARLVVAGGRVRRPLVALARLSPLRGMSCSESRQMSGIYLVVFCC